jgi:hypothetical protein
MVATELLRGVSKTKFIFQSNNYNILQINNNSFTTNNANAHLTTSKSFLNTLALCLLCQLLRVRFCLHCQLLRARVHTFVYILQGNLGSNHVVVSASQ